MKLSTYIFSITLTILLLFSSLRVSLTYAYYNIDRIGFIEILCENKDKLELQCQGKCHLIKVSKSQSKEQKIPESIVNFEELVLYPNSELDYTLIQENSIKEQNPIAYQNLYFYNSIIDCFHPPRVSFSS
ncbi:hypothetical protein [Xanthomarina sp. F2636L]|uniref:hypothetical protein n=1 Tax=Xanthomarina sp. F2636L TaxID=2996018 RepID=UPI00225DE5E3|nr:hypothetical protein [Xanthomarina sp. F2636L]MCX7550349.1 hypothetical protein [Xanthomarina sp. F2636L]